MFSGTNKLCQQCVKLCKQYRQNAVVKCPSFQSTQKKVSNMEEADTLQSGEIDVAGSCKDDISKDE